MAQANLNYELTPDELACIVADRFKAVSSSVVLSLYDASGNLVGYHKAVVTCEIPDQLPQPTEESMIKELYPEWRAQPRTESSG